LKVFGNLSLTFVSCTTGAPIFTNPHGSILMFIDGGALPRVADRASASAVMGTWRHLGRNSYTARTKSFEYTAAGTFNGTREIALGKNADEYTSTATSELYNAASQLIYTACVTVTATRFE
jgi:hypothetical protein